MKYAPLKMKDNPLWLSVTSIMRDGAGKTMQRLLQVPEFQPRISVYLNRINAIENIKAIDLHIEEVAGEDKTVDVVVDIFNRVNSGGTKLSKGDLTLAKICAGWPDARDEMKRRLAKWRKAGYEFKLDWLLRNINAVVTGDALFAAMKNVSSEGFREGLETSEKVIDRILNLIASRLGLDHDRVLGSRYAIPLMSRYIVQRGGKLPNQAERDRLLYWYVHTILWGRYSGSTESKLNTDLEAIEDATTSSPGQALNRLTENLRQERANLLLAESDFGGSSKGNRFYPLLYMMTRVLRARDWGTGDALTNHLLGHLMQLQVHHIFPKALLYKYGYAKRQVNAIANFTFLTQETNLEVWKRNPAEYIPEYEKRTPGAIASHWIPVDPELWKPENYLKFLEERRRLLARAANDFLARLSAGSMPLAVSPDEVQFIEKAAAWVPGTIDDEEEAKLIRCNTWATKRGLPPGDLSYELIDEKTGEVMAILDLAWPNGLQEGLSQPVAILLGEGQEAEEAASQAGYRFFASVKAFRKYVKEEILGEAQLVPAANHDAGTAGGGWEADARRPRSDVVG